MHILFVGLGGFMGAILRYLVVKHLPVTGAFPLSILTVNVAGSFLLGLLLFMKFNGQPLPDEYRNLLVVGFLGSLTTMSALAGDTLDLYSSGQIFTAFLNIFCNIFFSLLAVVAGKFVSGYFFG